MANENKPIKKNEHDREHQRRGKEEKARRTRRRLRQVMGFALSVLMVVGAISIVQWTVEILQNTEVDTGEADYYEQLLMPMVWFDQLPFESLAQADPNAIKQEIIWGVLNELDEEIEYNDLGQPLVPAVEMDQYAAELFGAEYKLEHESFEDPVLQLRYEFDPQTNMYAATATGLNAQYVGDVREIEELDGGILRVTMGYVSNFGSNNELIATPDFDNPTKYMDYFFRRDGSEYYLYALRPNTSYAPAQASSSQSNTEDTGENQGEVAVEDLLAPSSLAAESAGDSSEAAGEEAELEPVASESVPVSSLEEDNG